MGYFSLQSGADRFNKYNKKCLVLCEIFAFNLVQGKDYPGVLCRITLFTLLAQTAGRTHVPVSLPRAPAPHVLSVSSTSPSLPRQARGSPKVETGLKGERPILVKKLLFT